MNAVVPALIVILNAAHAMNRENPEPFNKAVLEFLSEH
jgi:pimeloyl-ACP methyl ester carboxylesterase